MLSFVRAGRIAKVLVREGDQVKKNQVLMQQDDDAEQAMLSLIRRQSEDMNQIDAQKASLAQKKVYLKRLELVAQRGSATKLEVEDAKLEVTITDLSLKAAELEHEQNRKKYEEAKIRVDDMKLKSPIDGRVEKVKAEVGESTDGLEDVVQVVRTDPLWVDVHVPFEQGRTLKLDGKVRVLFPGSDQTTVKGKIIFISTVADAASSTLRVRIEVENKSDRPAGEHITVIF
jgi:HlyD family secretion protein